MLRYLFIVAALSVPAGAAFQPVTVSSDGYLPGSTTTFEVRLPQMSNLGAYNVDIVLGSTEGTPGIDFFFDVGKTVPGGNYVFPSTANYFAATAPDPLGRDRVTLSDFDFAGADVVPGVNDRLVVGAFHTSSSFHGQLSLFVDAPSLILDTPSVTPTPVAGFSAIQSNIAQAGPVTVSPAPIPEPSGFAIAAVITAMCVRRRRT